MIDIAQQGLCADVVRRADPRSSVDLLPRRLYGIAAAVAAWRAVTHVMVMVFRIVQRILTGVVEHAAAIIVDKCLG